MVSIPPSVDSPPDNVELGETSPPQDMSHFNEQVLRMAQSLGVEAQQPVEEIHDLIYDVMHTESLGAVSIPFIPMLLQTVKQSWKSPASAAPTSRRVESLYKVQEPE